MTVRGVARVGAVEGTYRTRTYGNWRRPKSPGLLGLGSFGTLLLVTGLIVSVIVVMAAGILAALVWLALLGVVVLLVQARDAHGRNVVQRVGARLGWWSTRIAGAHIYRSGPLGRTRYGTFQLPGIAAATTLTEHRDSYGRPFALLWVPATSSYTVVLGSDPDGAALVDPDQVDLWVADWGHWLRQLGEEPGLTGASVTIETAPDPGLRLRREVTRALDPDANPFSAAVLHDILDIYPAGSSVVRAYLALTFTGKAGGKRRPADEMARDLAARLPGLTGGLQSTGAGVAGPLSAAQLCELVAVAYDPAAAAGIEELHARGEEPDLRWPDVGPVGAEASWDAYRHDSGTSRTWAMSQAPRGLVTSSVLTRLLEPHPAVARKRVTVIYSPIDAARAAALVEADVRAAEFTATNRHRAHARDSHALRAATATAMEEAAGAGLVDFAVLVTATVTDPACLPDATSAINNLAGTARLRLRVMTGSQDSGFAAALPLGLSLAGYSTIPSLLREKL